MEKQVKRSVNWDQDEKDLLSNLVLEKLDIIENAKIDTNTNKKKKEAWSIVHNLFSTVSKRTKTLEQMHNQWRKTKCIAKTKNSAYVRQRKQTCGGPAPEEHTPIKKPIDFKRKRKH